eukprot:TRINITY_DN4348_c0_g1::TRINITY_DN4348_c0_g1_i1::g.21255::m.21255 TRINITY_DN4348_c0_g1::TRINITY_DN4348_c0_g1_i1::g.21255  ORF type:complete len:123 (+),score=-14.76,XPA_N/PF01286.13/0.18,C1_3/PF07649.7/1.3e+03,C1_3/PF07649.7/0.47 TRINITY_DN4348_c0_g1_i1:308-676(+)
MHYVQLEACDTGSVLYPALSCFIQSRKRAVATGRFEFKWSQKTIDVDVENWEMNMNTWHLGYWIWLSQMNGTVVDQGNEKWIRWMACEWGVERSVCDACREPGGGGDSGRMPGAGSGSAGRP